VVLTGYDDGRHAQAFFDLGAVGYLLKETPLDQLAVLLRAVYAGHTCFGAAAAGKLHASGGAPAASRLTPREAEVLRLVASDRQNAEIAAELCVCVKTVESHVSNVLQKMGVRSRGAAALKAHNLNLL
jgi:DNA-binding NarL/FixJ family response regulator